MGVFVIWRNERGYRFNLRAVNDKVIATSQMYKTLTSCKGGISSVQTCAPTAAVENQTGESFKPLKCPKFQIYIDEAGEFKFRLLAKNGQSIIVSEGYASMDDCQDGIESVRKNVANADVVLDKE